MAGSFSVSTIFTARDRMSPTFKRMGRNANKFGGALRSLIGPLAAAFSAREILRFGNESIDLWNKQAEAIANVDATLRSTGGTVGRTLSELEAQAASLQKNTFFGDEEILKGVTAQMLTFTNITGESFDRASAAVLDVSAKLKGLDANEETLRSTTIALSKALNDPVANLGALSRSGIQFDDVQKELIKTLFSSGQVMEAQNIILTEIEKQYGGTAAAIAKTDGGLQRSTENMIGDMQEVIGRGLAPLRLKFLQFQATLIEKVIPKIEQFFDFATVQAPKVVEAFDRIVSGLKTWSPVIIGITTAITAWKVATIALVAVQKIQAALMVADKFMLVTKFIFSLARAQGVLTAAQTALNIAMQANPIGLIIAGVTTLVTLTVLLVKHWDTIVEKIRQARQVDEETKRRQDLASGQALFGGELAAAFGGGEAPNRREAEARQQISNIVDLNIRHARELEAAVDSTSRGAPGVRTHMLGATQ